MKTTALSETESREVFSYFENRRPMDILIKRAE